MASLAKQLLELSNIMQQIDDNNGEIDPSLLPVLTQVELSIADKVDNYVGLYDAVTAELERKKKVRDNFSSLVKTLENLQTRLKSTVKQTMEAHDLIKIEGNEREIKLLNSGGSQAIEKPGDMFYNEECVDPKYLIELEDHVEEKFVYVIKDKEKFKEAIRKNRIPSCFVLPRGKYVRFV